MTAERPELERVSLESPLPSGVVLARVDPSVFSLLIPELGPVSEYDTPEDRIRFDFQQWAGHVPDIEELRGYSPVHGFSVHYKAGVRFPKHTDFRGDHRQAKGKKTAIINAVGDGRITFFDESDHAFPNDTYPGDIFVIDHDIEPPHRVVALTDRAVVSVQYMRGGE